MSAAADALQATRLNPGDPTVPTTNSSSNCNCWKLLCCNMYLIPSFAVNKDNATCTMQSERAAALGRVIVKDQPDVVFLQEAWGAGQGSIEQCIVPAGYCVGDYCRSWFGLQWLDSFWQYANSRGGLWYAHNTRTTVPKGVASWSTYSISATKSKKGMVATRFASKVPGRGSLLVVNTHLDPSNRDNFQLKQVAELARFVQSVVREAMQDARDAPAVANTSSGGVGNSADFGLVIVGDFNFPPSSKQYKETFDIFKGVGNIALREILPSESLATATYSRDCPLVQWKSDHGRLDLIFAVDSVDGVELKPVKMVSERVRSDLLVSDHYPFECVLAVE